MPSRRSPTLHLARSRERIQRFATTVGRLVRSPEAIPIVVVLLGVVALHVLVLVFIPSNFFARVLGTLISLLSTLLAVYVSIDVVLPHLKYAERRRIASAPAIVGAYDSTEPFIDLTESAYWGRLRRCVESSAVPIAVEQRPDSPRPLAAYEYTLDDRMYETPPELDGVLAPVDDELQQLFRHEGGFSELKPRLDRLEGETLHFSKTSYYHSFRTNFCPDYDVGSGRTIRDLTTRQVLRGGDLVPLAESPFSNHLGGAGLVVTTDGRVVLNRRSAAVAVDKYTTSLSFSGALDLSPVEDGASFETVALDELTEELGVPVGPVVQSYCLGFTRRVERLSKPDVVTLVLLDETADWHNSTDEHEVSTTVNVEGVDCIDERTLFDPRTADAVIRAVLDHLERTTYEPSLGLLSWLWLYERAVADDAGK